MLVKAYGDDLKLELADTREAFPEESELRMRKLILTHCVKDLDESGAALLLERDGKAVAELCVEVFKLTDEFDAEREKIRGEAEKNSSGEESGATER